MALLPTDEGKRNQHATAETAAPLAGQGGELRRAPSARAHRHSFTCDKACWSSVCDVLGGKRPELPRDGVAFLLQGGDRFDARRKSSSLRLGNEAWLPIVGVGTSAGGLEAFTQLLGALPLDTGMGFVVVQHLDPDHESQLAQILSTHHIPSRA